MKNLTCITPRTMDIFILSELVNTSPLSVPCQPGSKPNGYLLPLSTAVMKVVLSSGKVQPECQRWSDLEKTSLYMRPVYIENTPINKIMYRPL